MIRDAAVCVCVCERAAGAAMVEGYCGPIAVSVSSAADGAVERTASPLQASSSICHTCRSAAPVYGDDDGDDAGHAERCAEKEKEREKDREGEKRKTEIEREKRQREPKRKREPKGK